MSSLILSSLLNKSLMLTFTKPPTLSLNLPSSAEEFLPAEVGRLGAQHERVKPKMVSNRVTNRARNSFKAKFEEISIKVELLIRKG